MFFICWQKNILIVLCMYIYIYLYLYLHRKRYIYIYVCVCAWYPPKNHVGNLAVSTLFFTHFLLQTLGHFGDQKNAFLATCCNPTLPILHRIQDSRSRIRLVESKRVRIQDSNFLNPKELDSRFKIQTNFFNPRLNLESWILNPERLDPRSFLWVLNLEAWLQVLRALSAASNWNF